MDNPSEVIEPISDTQRRMLEAGEFHVDGWTSRRGREAAADLERRGLVRSFEGGDSQYTAINYKTTAAGLRTLRLAPLQ